VPWESGAEGGRVEPRVEHLKTNDSILRLVVDHSAMVKLPEADT